MDRDAPLSTRGKTSMSSQSRSYARHSPGDMPSPIGIEFSRGSFSEHMLSLDSPSPLKPSKSDAPPSCPQHTTASSVLRSPTRKRPPPPPSAAPKPPMPSTSKGARAPSTASAILQPPPVPSATPARSTRVSMVSKKETATPPKPAPPPIADLSVNAVDALTKKLRQQAAELSRVYEQMEAKDTSVGQLQGEVKQLQVQLDMQRTRQRQTATRLSSTSIRTPVRKPPVPATSRGSMKVSSPVKSGRKPSTSERDDSNDASAAMHSLEKALTELRQCHQELMARSNPEASTKPTPIPISDIQQEQQLYIRVLEEAVHLKASELCVTGHEELLIVLAELRHTIYQQEQEIQGLHDQLSAAKTEQLDRKSTALEADEKLQRERMRWESELASTKAKEATLQQQLDEAQRLIHAEHMRYRQERHTLDEQAAKVSSLEKELRLRTQELKQWETTRADSWGKKESKLAATIHDLQSTLESERVQSSKVKSELEAAQRQIEELKALQEGLLESIDGFVAKEEAHEIRGKQVEELSASVDSLQRENKSLHDRATSLTERVESLTKSEEKNAHSAAQWEALEADIAQLHADVEALTQASDLPAMEQIERWLEILKTSSLFKSANWLGTFTTQLVSSARSINNALIEMAQDSEKACLKVRALEESMLINAEELRQLKVENEQVRLQHSQREEQTASTRLRIIALEEELKAAKAQEGLGAALAEQIFELEELHKAVQERLSTTLAQNQALVVEEEELTLQLRAKNEENDRLYKQLRQYQDQHSVVCELETELESAASLIEHQNALNQRLTVDLERLEFEQAEKDALCASLQTETEAFTSRFTTLFTQYMQFVAANKQRIAGEYGVVGDGARALPSTYEEAVSSGDALQMLRVFPALVEEYLASAILGIEQSNSRSSRKPIVDTSTSVGKAVMRQRSTYTGPEKRFAPVLMDPYDSVREDERDELALRSQLQEIAHAFHSFKAR